MDKEAQNRKAFEDFMKIFQQQHITPEISSIDQERKKVQDLQDMMIKMMTMRQQLGSNQDNIPPFDSNEPKFERQMKYLVGRLNNVADEILKALTNMNEKAQKMKDNGPVGNEWFNGEEEDVVNQSEDPVTCQSSDETINDNHITYYSMFELMPLILGIMDNHLINKPNGVTADELCGILGKAFPILKDKSFSTVALCHWFVDVGLWESKAFPTLQTRYIKPLPNLSKKIKYDLEIADRILRILKENADKPNGVLASDIRKILDKLELVSTSDELQFIFNTMVSWDLIKCHQISGNNYYTLPQQFKGSKDPEEKH
jgi:hypothetical protein